MEKNIIVIIGHRGIGDLIYHLPLLRSLKDSYPQKIYIFSNKINQAKEVYKNETFYERIIEFDNHRYGPLKTIKNIIDFKNKLNALNPKYLFLTSSARRLSIPALLCKAEKKFIWGTGKLFINKNNSLNNLTSSQKILQFTKNLNLLKKNNSFLLNDNHFHEIQNKIKKVFIVIDSHHNQNNWPTENFIKIIKKLYKKNKVYINFSPNKKYFLKLFPPEIINSKNINFTYKNKISDIIDIIYSCDVVIGNETGPVCLGSALKKKVHAIYIPIHTLPESMIINKKNKYYNAHLLGVDTIIKKIISSI